MDRYYMFRKMLDFVNDDFDITDADINTYNHHMVVEGVSPDGNIRIEFTPRIRTAKEEEADA